jgi:tetratricopeptide (TPR) repeat protein
MRKEILLILFFLFILPIFIYSNTLKDAYREYLYGDYEEGIKEALKCREDDSVLYFLGLTYLKLGDYYRARLYFRRLLKSFSDSKFYEQALLKFADTYFLEGNLKKAKVLYEKIKRKYPSFNFLPTVYLRLAQIASKEGRWQDKKNYLKKIKNKFPHSIEVKFVNLLENYGDYFTIQVGAFSKKENALNLKKELSVYYPVYILESKLDGYTLYKVRIGKFKHRKEAEKVYQRLLDQGYPARIYP